MAPRRPKTSVNDVPLPIQIPTQSTTTGGLEPEKTKKPPRKKPDFGRMQLPDMSKRKLISRLERDPDDPMIITLNNGLVNIEPNHIGWKVRDERSHEILRLYGYGMDDPDFEVIHCNMHAELEEAEDGFWKLINFSHASSRMQALFLLEKLNDAHDITDEVIIDRVRRDACFPYISVGDGVDRIGNWLTTQVADYVAHVTPERIELLKNPPAHIRHWGDRENQIFSPKFRSDAYYDAMHLDRK